MDDVSHVRQENDPYRQKVRMLAGQEVILDAEGFFSDPRQWTEEVAQSLAREAGLTELSETQWAILRFLRRLLFRERTGSP